MEKHRALVTNSLVFGGLSGGAELSQQVLLRRVFPREEERRPLDWAAVGRYLVVGLIIWVLSLLLIYLLYLVFVDPVFR